MTILEFFDSYLDLWVEYSSIANVATTDQCVDLFQVYNNRVVGGPNTSGNAVDYFTNYPTDFYEKIVNTPTGVPQLGDVIVWGTKYGTYGHIAICTDIASTTGFTSFDQNDPYKSRCHFQPHTYTGVLGWLRPKSVPSIDPDKVKIDLGEPWGVQEVQAIKSMLKDAAIGLTSALEKGKQLDGFISKWVTEWNLPTGSSLVDVEGEMAKLLSLEDTLQKYRDGIEGVVGAFETDSALLEALHAVKSDKDALSKQVTDLLQKLADVKQPSGYTFIKSWTIYSLLFRLYKKVVN